MFKFKIFLTATVLIFGFFLFPAPRASAMSMSIGNPVEVFNLWTSVRSAANKTYLKIKEDESKATVYSVAERREKEAEFSRFAGLIKRLSALSEKFATITGFKGKNKVTVIYPNGGELFECGKKYNIIWKTKISKGWEDINRLSNPVFGVILSAVDEFGGTYVAERIARNIKFDSGRNGEYTYAWRVPCFINSGLYAIRVVANPDIKILTFEDSSDNSFSLKGQKSLRPNIRVEFPVKGSILKIGDKYEIKWTSENLSDKVSISLQKPMDPNFNYVIAKDIPNSGSFIVDTSLWAQNIAPDDYLLRIYDNDNPMYGKFFGNSFKFSVSR